MMVSRTYHQVMSGPGGIDGRERAVVVVVAHQAMSVWGGAACALSGPGAIDGRERAVVVVVACYQAMGFWGGAACALNDGQERVA